MTHAFTYRGLRVTLRHYPNGWRAQWTMDGVHQYSGAHNSKESAKDECKQRIDVHLGEKVKA